jgi:Family of unknown function (DUF6011)
MTTPIARCRNCAGVIRSCECGTCDGWRHAGGDHQCPSGWKGTDKPTYAEPAVRCRRSSCRRVLTSKASIANGIGRWCAAKERAEQKAAAAERALQVAVAPYSARQRQDAVVLAGRITPAERPGLWLVPSSDGVSTYRATAGGCPCQSRGPCRHMAAVALRETFEAYQEVA